MDFLMRRWHWFQFVAYTILALFFGIMLCVTTIAYTRHSGSTGLDMAAIQKIRHHALPQHSHPPHQP